MGGPLIIHIPTFRKIIPSPVPVRVTQIEEEPLQLRALQLESPNKRRSYYHPPHRQIQSHSYSLSLVIIRIITLHRCCVPLRTSGTPCRRTGSPIFSWPLETERSVGILIHRTIAAACKTTRPAASSQAVVLLMDIKTLCKRKNRRRRSFVVAFEESKKWESEEEGKIKLNYPLLLLPSKSTTTTMEAEEEYTVRKERSKASIGKVEKTRPVRTP